MSDAMTKTEADAAAAVEDDERVVDGERYDVQRAAQEVLLHMVKATCEGLIEAITNAPYVDPADAEEHRGAGDRTVDSGRRGD